MNGGQFATGLFLGALVSGFAYLVQALSMSGAVAATAVGGLTFGIGGLVPAVLLLLFFVSSSGLSRLGGGRKRALAPAFAKGGRRDHGQVLANGGLAAALAIGYGLGGQVIWLVALAGALAAVNADTWATELGVLFGTRPRLITSLLPVEAGTSGAVTAEGVAAAAAGGALIALAAGWLVGDGRLLLAAGLGGLAGALLDSLLGASLQAVYYCPACGKETERHPTHTCGGETRLRRGWRWMGNDLVNFAASLAGALIAAGVWRALML